MRKYALLLVLIAIVVIGVLTVLGGGPVSACPPGTSWSPQMRGCF